MDILILIVVMVIVGLLIGWIAGSVLKEEPPYGKTADYLISIASAVIIGLLDWYVIPKMGFSDTMKYLGVALEPALGALFILWILRRAKK
jgi:uncharacterized membrane protein YeaQ/YmgE (transglycosylase-associated protein family)